MEKLMSLDGSGINTYERIESHECGYAETVWNDGTPAGPVCDFEGKVDGTYPDGGVSGFWICPKCGKERKVEQ